MEKQLTRRNMLRAAAASVTAVLAACGGSGTAPDRVSLHQARFARRCRYRLPRTTANDSPAFNPGSKGLG